MAARPWEGWDEGVATTLQGLVSGGGSRRPWAHAAPGSHPAGGGFLRLLTKRVCVRVPAGRAVPHRDISVGIGDGAQRSARSFDGSTSQPYSHVSTATRARRFSNFRACVHACPLARAGLNNDASRPSRLPGSGLLPMTWWPGNRDPDHAVRQREVANGCRPGRGRFPAYGPAQPLTASSLLVLHRSATRSIRSRGSSALSTTASAPSRGPVLAPSGSDE